MRITNVAWLAAIVAMQPACTGRETAPAPQRAPSPLSTDDALSPEPRIGSVEEADEPPLHYRVELDGRTLVTTDNQTVTAHGTFSDPTLTISALDFRYLRRRGVTVPFPSYYSFEAELGVPDMWTLSGNDFKIMLFDFGMGRAPLRETVESTLEELGVKAEQRGLASLELNGHTLIGEALTFQLAGHVQRYEVYAVPGPRAQLLLFLDSPPTGAAESKERGVALDALRRSFRVAR